MMLSDALTLKRGDLLHYGTCTVKVGARGGKKYKVETWRVNGAVKTWKRSPERIEVPIKYGLYGYGYLTEKNVHEFHRSDECYPEELP